MIISASRRTDIPAFFADWFYNRLEEGFVVTRNPFNANQLTKLRLDSEVVDAIVFWTKNPKPMLSRLDLIEKAKIPYYFQFSITPYGQDIELRLPKDKNEIINTFKALSNKIGPDRVIWRYDPIIFSEKYNLNYHERAYERCANLLAGYTKKSVISFLDLDYRNTKAINKLGISDGSIEEKNKLAKRISDIASSLDILVETCAEDIDLETFNIKHSKCIDAELIEAISGKTLKLKGHAKDKNQRQICGCVASSDIGVYNTCHHSCLYCYANYSTGSIQSNCARHDKKSPLLIGGCDASILEFQKDQRSYFETQLKLENIL